MNTSYFSFKQTEGLWWIYLSQKTEMILKDKKWSDFKGENGEKNYSFCISLLYS